MTPETYPVLKSLIAGFLSIGLFLCLRTLGMNFFRFSPPSLAQDGLIGTFMLGIAVGLLILANWVARHP